LEVVKGGDNMAYDQDKVDFTPEEHDAARCADELYEKIQELVADGVDLTDLTKLPALFGPTMRLYKWLASEDRAEFASKLLTLSTALSRDNVWL
jgi:hypothetical protein